MYSKEQASALKQSFWTAFGQYMAPIPSAEGAKVNWINYKTGIKYVQFRMITENSRAEIAVEITHPDAGLQELYFEQFKELKIVFTDTLQEEWQWLLHVPHEGKSICRIVKSIQNASVYNREDWSRLISFFKPRIIALDEFWNVARYGFESLH